MGATATIHRTVAFADTDMAGIVHFSNFLRYCEAAESALFAELGIPIIEEVKPGLYRGWPRVEVSCRYRAPLRFPEPFRVEIEVESVEIKRVRLIGRIYREPEGTRPVARCETVLAYASLAPMGKDLQALPIPEAWQKALLG